MKFVILDRDGVINQDSDDFIKTVEEFIPIPGSLDAMARLTKAGYKIAVATNQSGIGRGLYSVETLHAMHDKLNKLLAEKGGKIEAIFYCPHSPEDDCLCRKPRPGLMHQIAERFQIDLNGVPIIGDSLRDLQAGQAVGCFPVLVKTGKGLRTIKKAEGLEGVVIYEDLADAVNALLAEVTQ